MTENRKGKLPEPNAGGSLDDRANTGTREVAIASFRIFLFLLYDFLFYVSQRFSRFVDETDPQPSSGSQPSLSRQPPVSPQLSPSRQPSPSPQPSYSRPPSPIEGTGFHALSPPPRYNKAPVTSSLAGIPFISQVSRSQIRTENTSAGPSSSSVSQSKWYVVLAGRQTGVFGSW